MSEPGIDHPTREAILATIGGVTMVSGLTFVVVEPFIALYIVLAAGLVGLVLALWERDDALRTPQTLALLAAIVLLAIPIPFVWKSSEDLVGLLIFLPLLVAPGVTYFAERDARWLTPFTVPILCLFGVLGALGGGLFEHYVLGGDRAGMGNNPIHFGGMAVIVGFLSLSGVAVGKSPWRFIFLLAPAAALWVCLLSGSRGPLLAWFVLAAISAVVLLIWYWRDLVFLGLVGLVGAALGYAYFNFDGASRAFRLFATIDAAADGETLSRSDQVRVLLYDSAWEQFLTSPIFGQGFGQLMDAAAPRLAAMQYPLLENLHSDIADFAVVAGSFGLLAFGLIILSPLTVVVSGSGWGNRPVLFGAIMLSAGYLVLGLTNAMFGVLAQTVLYGMLVGILAALARAGNQAVRASSTA